MFNIDDSWQILIARSLSGELSDKEQNNLQSWIEESRGNRLFYEESLKIWQATAPPEPDHIPDLSTSWENLEKRLNLKDEPSGLFLNKSSAKQNKPFFLRYGIVAAAVLVIFLVYLTVLRLDPWKVSITPNGETSEVVLDDNSTVLMNAGSELRYPEFFSDSIRIVQLEGQAFFKIAASDKPFIVETENARVRVLGTRFDVYSRYRRTEVIVQKGKVLLTSLMKETFEHVILQKNQMGLVDEYNKAVMAREENADYLIGWLEDRFVFHKTPLGEAVAEIERRHDVDIRFSDDSLKRHTMSGSFEDTSVDSTLEAFCLALNLSYSKEGHTYLISK